jgi:lipopolysaccharide export system protein LptA
MDLMNPIRKKTFSAACLLFLPLLLFSQPGWSAETKGRKTLGSGDAPVVIRSNSLEVDNKKRVVSFVGAVEARKEDMLIRCQKMFVYYSEDAGKGEKKGTTADGAGLKIEKIVAIGDVKIDRTEGGGSATADEAVYYEAEEKIVLQGKPVVKQGDDFVEGSTITLFLKEDRSVVEGASDQKVRAVISPRNQKR